MKKTYLNLNSIWACAVLSAAVCLVYWNSFPGAFHFDDFHFVLQNPWITSSDFPQGSLFEMYGGRPLTLWSFHWNYSLFGQNPFPYHLINVLLHALAVLTLFFLLQQHFKQRLLCLGTALIFALHPLQSQAVNYIWSRSELMMSLFGLLALALIKRHPLGAVVLFQLAIWSRAEAIVLVIFLILLRPEAWKNFATVAIVNLFAVTYSLAKYTPEDTAWNHSDVAGYWLQQGVVFWRYLLGVLWPFQLNVDHDFQSASLAVCTLALLGVALLYAWVFRVRKQHPVPAVGAVWFLATLLPSFIVPNPDLINESRAYLALAGVALAVASVLSQLPSGSRFFSFRGIAVMSLLAVMAQITVARNGVWRDDVSLWRDAVAKSPRKARVHYNLGAALARQGKLPDAEVEFEIAHRLNPTDDFSIAGLGFCAAARGDWQASRSLYQRALRQNPENRFARDKLSELPSH